MSRITTCPHCSTRLRVSEQITDKTLICPHCLADVDNPWPGSQIRAADINTDVKRDMKTGCTVLPALIGFCVLGIALAFFFGLQYRGKGSGPFGLSIFSLLIMMASFGVLEVHICIAIIRGFIRWGATGVRTPSVGRVIGIVFLTLGTIVAVVYFFCCTCFGLVLLQS